MICSTGVVAATVIVAGSLTDLMLVTLPFAHGLNAAMLVLAVILAATCFHERTRPVAGKLLIAIAAWWGIVVWCCGFVATYQLWGAPGLVAGMFLMGVGVVLTGLAVCLASGQWSEAWFLVGNVVIASGVYGFGRRILRRSGGLDANP